MPPGGNQCEALQEKIQSVFRLDRSAGPRQAVRLATMSSGLRAGAWYMCFTCKSCSQPIPYVECAPDSKMLPAVRVTVVSVRCPYPTCTARHDYVTSDLFKVQAELPGKS